jgi:hypothetical protein
MPGITRVICAFIHHFIISMKRIPFLVLAIAASSAFVGCGSDNKSEDPTPKSNSELLMAKSWKLTAETEATGNAAPVNTYDSSYESYEKDNVYKFQANDVLVMEEGATRENPSDPASTTGVWKLMDSDKNLAYQVGFFGTALLSSTQKGEIEELTATKLVVKMTDSNNSPAIVTRQTFTAQ